LNDGEVLNQKGEVVDATSCQVTVPSTIVPPALTEDQFGSVLDVVPVDEATKILFVPVPGVANVSKVVGITYVAPDVAAVVADQISVV